MLIILTAVICVMAIFLGHYALGLWFTGFCVLVLLFKHHRLKSNRKNWQKILEQQYDNASKNITTQKDTYNIAKNAPVVNEFLSSH